MEPAGNGVVAKPHESRPFVPSIMQPCELSGRPDSLISTNEKADRARLQAAEGKAELVFADRKLVEEAAAWITAKIAVTLRIGAQEVGDYVLDKFFSSDSLLAKSKNPHKNASFRALANKCGTAELPISKTWLNNAVGVASMLRQLPEAARAFRELPPSYQETLLPLRDPTKVEKIAKQAATKDLSYRELREVVATERAKKPKDDSRGRPRAPLILKTLTRSLRVFTLEGGKRSFTKADFEELGKEQRKDALRSAEALIEKLKDLVIRLKRA